MRVERTKLSASSFLVAEKVAEGGNALRDLVFKFFLLHVSPKLHDRDDRINGCVVLDATHKRPNRCDFERKIEAEFAVCRVWKSG
jgi:hypothetical protein